jgi:hypothetical protein
MPRRRALAWASSVLSARVFVLLVLSTVWTTSLADVGEGETGVRESKGNNIAADAQTSLSLPPPPSSSRLTSLTRTALLQSDFRLSGCHVAMERPIKTGVMAIEPTTPAEQGCVILVSCVHSENLLARLLLTGPHSSTQGRCVCFSCARFALAHIPTFDPLGKPLRITQGFSNQNLNLNHHPTALY